MPAPLKLDGASGRVSLFALFFAGACEHFAFFGVRGLLTDYLIDDAGPGWEMGAALELFGIFTLVSYAAYLPGGYLADRFTARWGVVIGGLVACGGCLVLAVPDTRALYPGLLCVALGAGVMRPSLWTMVGRVAYASRDVAFGMLFLAVNLGSALSGFGIVAAGYTYGWNAGFALAAAGLVVGQAFYMSRLGSLRGLPNSKQAAGRSLSRAEVQRALVVGFVTLALSLSSVVSAFAMSPVATTAAFAQLNWTTMLSSGFMILLLGPITYFWIVWKRRGHRASALWRIALGIMITGWGPLFALPFVTQFEFGAPAPWVGWLVLPQLFVAIGTLLMIPVAWSFISKVAPLRHASLTMGVFLGGTALLGDLLFLFADKLVGETLETHESFVLAGAAVLATVLGAAVIAVRKPLERLARTDEG